MKKAFTMLELVFVIVVIGILAAAIIPNTKTNSTSEAAIKLESQIRYVQHLALIDDKFDATNSSWYKNLWQIAFNGNQYSIVSNNNLKFAKDSITKNIIQNVDLSADYGVTVGFDNTSGCSAETDISFDHIGRPISGDLNAATSKLNSLNLLTTACRITLTGSDGTIETIQIEPETGYAHRI